MGAWKGVKPVCQTPVSFRFWREAERKLIRICNKTARSKATNTRLLVDFELKTKKLVVCPHNY